MELIFFYFGFKVVFVVLLISTPNYSYKFTLNYTRIFEFGDALN